MNIKKCRPRFSVVIVALALFVLVGQRGPRWYEDYKQHKEDVAYYEEGERLLANKDYENASENFTLISDEEYRDAEALRYLSCVLKSYEKNGEIEPFCFSSLRDMKFKYVTPEQQKQIDDLMAKWEVIYKEQEKQRQNEKEASERTKIQFGDSSNEKSEEKKSSSSSSSSRKTTNKKEEDPYYVNEYDDPEDFHDDNAEDFDGVEDAETYWEDEYDYDYEDEDE